MNRLKMSWYQLGDQLVCRWVDEGETRETVLIQQNPELGQGNSTVQTRDHTPASVSVRAA